MKIKKRRADGVVQRYNVVPKIASEDLVLDNVHTGSHSGQQDYLLRIGNNASNLVYGYVEYSIFDKKVHISHIFVYEAYRRKGYATRLMNKIRQLYPKMPIIEGMMTRDGVPFFKAWRRKK